MMASSHEWQRSSIGITPIVVRARAGHKVVNKRDSSCTRNKKYDDISQVRSPGTSLTKQVSASVPGGAEQCLQGPKAGRVCSVCTRASATYSCPRCLIAYCSSKCYKCSLRSGGWAGFSSPFRVDLHLCRRGDLFARCGDEPCYKVTCQRKDAATDQLQWFSTSDFQRADRVCYPVVTSLAQSIYLVTSVMNSSGTITTFARRSPVNPWRSLVSLEISRSVVDWLSLSLSNESSQFQAHGAACTEAFFREHVERETDIREQEDAEDGRGGARGRRANMVEVLRRVRNSDSASYPSLVPAEAAAHRRGTAAVGVAHEPTEASSQERAVSSGEKHTAGERFLSDERLEQLARALDSCGISGRSKEALDTRGQGSASREVNPLDLLTEDEQARFFREVANGRLGKLIIPWVPWWTKTAGVEVLDNHRRGAPQTPSLTSTSSSSPSSSSSVSGKELYSSPSTGASMQRTQPSTPEDSDADLAPKSAVSAAFLQAGLDSEDEACDRHSFSVLLSKVRNAPDFSTLAVRSPSPSLPALAADLAYAYVFVARLYNGCWCADPVGASLALVGVSPVLRDAATPSTVAEALGSCVKRAEQGEGVHSRAYAESLRKDVLDLCRDDRKLTCAYQDAWSLVEAAGRALAPSPSASPSSKKPASSKKPPSSKAQRKFAKELGKVEKRLGYFLLWARSHGNEAAPLMAAEVLQAQADRMDLEAACMEREKGVILNPGAC